MHSTPQHNRPRLADPPRSRRAVLIWGLLLTAALTNAALLIADVYEGGTEIIGALITGAAITLYAARLRNAFHEYDR